MPTNQQRRDAAKRKLERQLVRRQERNKSRRQRTIIAGAIAVVIVVAGVVWFVTKKPSETDSASSGSDTSTSDAADTPCVYTVTEAKTVKAVDVPDNTNPLATGTVDATINFGAGAVPITLDRSLGKCAVNAFISLAAQKFYDGTNCHRLTTDADFKILQCGDPSGTGRGGPGFNYVSEQSPEVTADPADTTGATPDQYPVGTIAMASTAPSSENGSQFFIVYGESSIPSGYTKIGTVSAEGLTVIDAIAAKGTVLGKSGVLDAPTEAVTIESVTVPEDALVPTEPPVVTSSDATDSVPTDLVPTDSVPTDTVATDAVPSDTVSTDAVPSDTASSEADPSTGDPTQ